MSRNAESRRAVIHYKRPRNAGKIAIIIHILVLHLALIYLSDTVLGEADNLNVQIPAEYLSLEPDEGLLAIIQLTNLKQASKQDVLVEYEVENPSGVLLLSKSETLAIDTQASLVRSISIPSGSERGIYRLVVTATYPDGSQASAIQTFSVEKNMNDRLFRAFGLVALITFVTVIIIVKSLSYIKKYSIQSKIHKIVTKRLQTQGKSSRPKG